MTKGKKENFKSEMQRRLCLLCDSLGVSNREFSRKIGKSDNYIATMNVDITVGVVNNIYTAYPQTNLYWLITGNGDVLTKEPLSEELSSYLKQENQELKNENKELLMEIGRLQGILSETKKMDAQPESAASCATATNCRLAE